jgi:hypothetical protein
LAFGLHRPKSTMLISKNVKQDISTSIDNSTGHG